MLPAGVLHSGTNRIVLRIAGAAGVHKATSVHFLYPAAGRPARQSETTHADLEGPLADDIDRALLQLLLLDDIGHMASVLADTASHTSRLVDLRNLNP